MSTSIVIPVMYDGNYFLAIIFVLNLYGCILNMKLRFHHNIDRYYTILSLNRQSRVAQKYSTKETLHKITIMIIKSGLILPLLRLSKL